MNSILKGLVSTAMSAFVAISATLSPTMKASAGNVDIGQYQRHNHSESKRYINYGETSTKVNSEIINEAKFNVEEEYKTFTYPDYKTLFEGLTLEEALKLAKELDIQPGTIKAYKEGSVYDFEKTNVETYNKERYTEDVKTLKSDYSWGMRNGY